MDFLLLKLFLQKKRCENKKNKVSLKLVNFFTRVNLLKNQRTFSHFVLKIHSNLILKFAFILNFQTKPKYFHKMLNKTISKSPSCFFACVIRFSSMKIEEIHRINKLITDLDEQTLQRAIEKGDRYYVNKMNGLCELMNAQRSVSIFRPRRMGKSTMINDLAFLYKTGKFFCS